MVSFCKLLAFLYCAPYKCSSGEISNGCEDKTIYSKNLHSVSRRNDLKTRFQSTNSLFCWHLNCSPQFSMLVIMNDAVLSANIFVLDNTIDYKWLEVTDKCSFDKEITKKKCTVILAYRYTQTYTYTSTPKISLSLVSFGPTKPTNLVYHQIWHQK